MPKKKSKKRGSDRIKVHVAHRTDDLKITVDKDTNSKRTDLSKRMKENAEKLIDDWKDCPDSVHETTSKGTLVRSPFFRIDVQGTYTKKSGKTCVNIQEQINVPKDRKPTTISTVIVPCGEKVGGELIKKALYIGLGEDKGKTYIRPRTGLRSDPMSSDSQSQSQ